MTATRHHPVFARFAEQSGSVGNWLGVTTSRDYFTPALEFVPLALPPIDPEYLEWIDVLEAVTAARDRFTMLELGAGYGRWIVNAAVALRRFSGLPHRLVAVEAEPSHFRWLKRHCRENAVSAKLVRAAVAPVAGRVEFAVGNPQGWYGQAIADGTWSPEAVTRVKAVTLSQLLRPFDRVDFIHMDVQGAELGVLEEGKDDLSRVVRIHVGTHNREVEGGIRELFGRLGWTCENDYPSAATAQTPWGTMEFQDGVQTWVNPGSA